MRNNRLAVLPTLKLVRSLPPRGALRWFACIAAFVLPFAGGLHADAPPTTLQIAPAGTDIEGLKNFGLQWNAVPYATYLLERDDTLAPGSPWHSLDAIKPTDAVGSYQLAVTATDTKGFFRLRLPQPQITAVEPAVVDVSVPNAQLYILGQCLPNNGLVLINGLVFTPTIINSGGVWAVVTLNGLPPGQPWLDVAIIDPGTSAVLAKLQAALLGVDASSPYLQGPPDSPLASPSATLESTTGEMSPDGYRSVVVTNSVKSKFKGKALKPGISVTADSFDIVDGKKGLNAVNVKLARGAGGAGQDGGELSGSGLGINSQGNRGAVIQFDVVNAKTPTRSSRGGVSPFSGEVQLIEADLAIPGRGLDFVWARTYNSRIGRSSAPNGWTFSYDVRCALTTSGGMDVYDGTGRKDTFVLQTNGTYTCRQFFSEGTLTGNVFRLTFADTGYWEFNPLVGSATDGKLARIEDRNGNAILLNYDTSGRLVEIVDDLGRTNNVGYDTAGRISSVTDFSGRTVTYQYYQGLVGEQGGAGDLKSVTSPPVIGTPNGNDFPTGKTTTYTYSTGYLDDRENHLLLSVIDASGQTIRSYVYQHNQTDFEFLRCISMQHWTNTPTMISYLPQTPTPANQFATMRCIVNGPVGDVTECFFDARNRGVKLQEFTGRATPGVRVTATANRPAVKVRPGDPDSYETRWSWNNDSLCTREVGPGGQQVQCVYESDFDPATRARKRADCRVVREIASSPVDLDGDGAADLTERVWRYEYDPRFGSDPTASRGIPKGSYLVLRLGNGRILHGMFGYSSNPFEAQGDGRFAAKDISWSGSDGDDVCESMAKGNGLGSAFHDNPEGFICPSSCDSFVISSTDPRGNVTEGTYDPQGNCTSLRLPNVQGVEYALAVYNAQGQLTAITNAPDANGNRRVDTFSYISSGPQAGYLQTYIVDAGGLALTESYEYDTRGNLTRVIDPRSNDWLCTYNALDQLVQTESAALGGGGPGGYRIKTQFSYDANDNLTLVEEENRDAAGTLGTNPFWRTQFVYDGGQRLTGCWRDKNGALVLRCTEVSYNAANQVVLYRSPEAVNGNDPANTVAFAYDERGLDYRTIAAPGSPVQRTTQCDYDPNGNVTRVSAGLEGTASTTTMEYDGFSGFGSSSRAQPRRAPGAVARAASLQSYKGKDVVITRQKPCSTAFHQFERGDMNQPIILGAMWENSSAAQIAGAAYRRNLHDAARLSYSVRLSKVTDPMGNATTFHYDANDNLKVVRHFGQMNDVPGSTDNIRLAETRYEYDGLDRPIRVRDSFFSLPAQAPIGDGERTTTFAYAPNSECTSITDDLGRVTTFAYDTVCRPSSVTSPGGKSVIAVLRDQAGNITQTTQTDQPDLGGPPQVFVWTTVYDSLNRPVSASDNVGNSNLFAYDSRGNCTSARDANGNETVYGYDGLSRMVQYAVYEGQEALGIVKSSGQFAYDDNDRTTSSTDANGNVTLHTYDSLDRPTQTTQADGTYHTFVWSPRSNLIEETDANGTVIVHTYDLNDRCTASTITPGAGVAATTTFETFAYDGSSQLVSAINDDSHSEFEYDSHGNLSGNHADGWNMLSAYDSVGRRTSITYPGGRVLTYSYDVLDQCTNILETGASIASFSYAGPGRKERVSYGNGTFADVTYDGLAGTPNAPGDFGHGQINSITHRPAAGSPILVAVNLRYDPNGNKTLRTDTIFAPAIPRTTDLGLQYDGANRLTRATVTRDLMVLRDTVYGFDLMGNRTNVTGAASCSGSYTMDALMPGPLDFQMNQYTTTPCDTRSYDDNGNLVGRSLPGSGPVTYQYDYAGRLVLLQSVDLSSGSAVISTSTYAYDALGRRIAKTVSSGSLPPVTTQFLYDGASVIEERENNLVAASFVLDGSRSQDDGVIQMRRGGQDYFYHTDDQGNVLALSTTGGAVVERYDYDDYGKVTFLTSDGVATTATSSAVGNVYCWGGLRLDAETGLHNDDGGGYFDTQAGRGIRRELMIEKERKGMYRESGGNNPWSGGGDSPHTMQKGTVKFFNETKGFGFTRLLESIQDESKGFSSLIR